MARRKDRAIAVRMRLEGCSYSQIKQKLNLSKSTLSNWLSDYPLSSERIKELRDRNPQRIENYINTMRKKREKRMDEVYQKAKNKLMSFNRREVFIAGLFLYWGEGAKTMNSTTSLSNTDPTMIKFFLRWLSLFRIPIKKITLSLHLYSDMDKNKSINFWLKELKLPKSSLRTVAIKKSKLSDLTYKRGFGHGTCHIRVYNRDLTEYIFMGLKYIKDITQNMRV